MQRYLPLFKAFPCSMLIQIPQLQIYNSTVNLDSQTNKIDEIVISHLPWKI